MNVQTTIQKVKWHEFGRFCVVVLWGSLRLERTYLPQFVRPLAALSINKFLLHGHSIKYALSIYVKNSTKTIVLIE